MPHSLHLSLACRRYDRTEAIFRDQVQADGIRFACTTNLPPHEIFWRMSRFEEFDVSEFSFSSYLIARDRGTPKLIAVPAFPLRSFRHSDIFVRLDSDIEKPQDLRGKRVGVPEYQMTMALWVRGMLQDDYGVAPADVRWFTGGQVRPGRTERLPISLPSGVHVSNIVDETLDAMIDRGSLDAMVATRYPCAADGQRLRSVRRLFPDVRAAESDYFRRSGIFPIMHVIVIREAVLAEHPWVATNVYRMFLEAKQRWLDELVREQGGLIGLPWAEEDVEEAQQLMGRDFWSYGLDANRAVLETAVRYSAEQGLIRGPIPVDALFAPGIVQESLG